MKKILPVLMVVVLVFASFVAVALPEDRQIENYPLNTLGYEIKINVKSRIMGYTVTAKNIGNTPIEGNLTTKLTTEAWIILAGDVLKNETSREWLPDEEVTFKLGPVLGFGPSTLLMRITFKETGGNSYSKGIPVNGFIFLFFLNFDAPPVTFP